MIRQNWSPFNLGSARPENGLYDDHAGIADAANETEGDHARQ